MKDIDWRTFQVLTLSKKVRLRDTLIKDQDDYILKQNKLIAELFKKNQELLDENFNLKQKNKGAMK